MNRFIEIEQSGVETFIDWVLKFRIQLSIPHKLSEIGINNTDSKTIGHMAQQEPSASGNPKSLSAECYTQIFENTVSGKLS